MAAKKVKKKSAKKVEPVDTSKKIDELLNKATTNFYIFQCQLNQ